MKKKSLFSSHSLLSDIVLWCLGTCLYASGVSLFITPLHLATGGVTGVGILINYIFKQIPVGAFVFVANIPLFLIAWHVFGLKFIGRTVVATGMTAVMLDILAFLGKRYSFAYNGDERLVGVIFGGILMGAGLGIVFLGGATTGGTDILVKLIKLKMPQFSTGKLVLLVDMAVVIASGIVYKSLDSILYSIVAIFLSGLAIDRVISGRDHSKMLIIMTSEPMKVTDDIINFMGRGVSIIHAQGGYTKREAEMLLCVVKAHEVARIKKTVEKYDNNPFMIITDASEVYGLGFKSYKETL